MSLHNVDVFNNVFLAIICKRNAMHNPGAVLLRLWVQYRSNSCPILILKFGFGSVNAKSNMQYPTHITHFHKLFNTNWENILSYIFYNLITIVNL